MTESHDDHLEQDEVSQAGESGFSPSAEMTPGQLAEAKELGRRELRVSLLGRGVDLVYFVIAAVWIAVPNSPFAEWLTQISTSQTIQLVLLALMLLVGDFLVSLPLSFYGGHLLQHQYQLSAQSFGQWLWRKIKGLVLELCFGLVLVLALYWIIWTAHGWWWLVAAAGFFLLSIVLGQLAPVLILPIFYKVERMDGTDLQGKELSQRFSELTSGTGLSVEGIFKMQLSAETSKANAMLTGLGRTRRVILGDTLLGQFSLDEISVIFAHEVGHHVHRHIRKMILFGGVYSLLAFFLCDAVLRAWLPGESVNYAELPVLLPLDRLTQNLEPRAFSHRALWPLRTAFSPRTHSAEQLLHRQSGDRQPR